MSANHTLLLLHVVAAVIVIAWIVAVIREMRRLK
jgi:hypothetical protein